MSVRKLNKFYKRQELIINVFRIFKYSFV